MLPVRGGVDLIPFIENPYLPRALQARRGPLAHCMDHSGAQRPRQKNRHRMSSAMPIAMTTVSAQRQSQPTRRVVPADVGGSKAAAVRQYRRRNAGRAEAIQLRRTGHFTKADSAYG